MSDETATSEMTVDGFVVRDDLAYEMSTHMWVDIRDGSTVRVGMDPLGLETAGTLAQLQFVEPGDAVARGEAFGSLEAEKFVGPLVAPLSGTIVAVNTAAMTDPGIVERSPYDEGWLIEMTPSALEGELEMLARGGEPIREQFSLRVAEYRRDGVLAE
jgi:glycine cleavage system H protein